MKCLLVTLLGLCLAAARADIVVPGADGSDGAFSPTSNIEVDLSLAPDGTWNGTNQSPTHGVYDPEKWAVVFRYNSVNIPSGVTVTFKNHPSHAPVVWLVSGNVTIAGRVSVDGHYYNSNGMPGEGGPGGFEGGWSKLARTPGSSGRGVGGGGWRSQSNVGGGSYATAGSAPTGGLYGNSRILPLIGGSGGAGQGDNHPATQSGPGGGGAILIGAQGTIAIAGASAITAYGGATCTSGGGSGGAIRLIAEVVSGSGGLFAAPLGGGQCYGLDGGMGRIRIESVNRTFNGPSSPNFTDGSALPVTIWPDTMVPVVRVVSLGAASVPLDPRASFDFPLADVSLADPAAQTVVLEARNVPIGPNPPRWNVVVRVVPKSGQDFTVSANYVSGDTNLSTWEITPQQNFTLPNGFSAIQVRASAP